MKPLDNLAPISDEKFIVAMTMANVPTQYHEDARWLRVIFAGIPQDSGRWSWFYTVSVGRVASLDSVSLPAALDDFFRRFLELPDDPRHWPSPCDFFDEAVRSAFSKSRPAHSRDHQGVHTSPATGGFLDSVELQA